MRVFEIVLMPPAHPIILLKSNEFNMATVSVKRSILNYTIYFYVYTYITDSYPVYHEQQQPGIRTGTEAVRALRSTEHRARAVD